MGLSKKDIEVFYSQRARSWIVANRYKERRLQSQGMSDRQAWQNSHGHIYNKKDAYKMKENILANKRTKSRKIRDLGSYKRVCDNTYRHYDWVCGLFNTKRNKSKGEPYKIGGRGARR